MIARGLSKRRSATVSKLTRSQRAREGRSAFNRNKLDEICQHLDQLSSHWLSLKVGESMAVAWPSLAIVTDRSSA